MKAIIYTFVVIAILFSLPSMTISQVKVKGYYKENGTYVEPYYRSNPDRNPYNNWSYSGNTNPYTSKTATGNAETYINNYCNKSNTSTTDIYLYSTPSNYNSYSNSFNNYDSFLKELDK